MGNIMVLGASVLQVPLIQEVVKNGYSAVVVSPRKEDPGFLFATYSVIIDVRDEIEILNYARKYNIVAVITDQTDIPVRTAAFIAEKLGLPGIGYETSKLFTDKFLMREKCKELNIPTLMYKKVNTLEDALNFFKTINGPAILKPIDNQGSKGVLKIDSMSELKKKFKDSLINSPSGSVLIEQYVDGKEFVVEGICYNYNFQNLVSGDTNYFDMTDVFSANTRTFPSVTNSDLIERVERLNERIIRGFGLKQGITHSEFITDGEEIYLIETAARGGGVFISSDIISIMTGINTEKFLIDISTDNLERLPEILDKSLYSGYVSFFLPVGKVVLVDGIEFISKLDFTHRHNLESLTVNLEIISNTDKTSRFFVIVSGNSQEDFNENIKTIKKVLKVQVETSKGTENPIWE